MDRLNLTGSPTQCVSPVHFSRTPISKERVLRELQEYSVLGGIPREYCENIPVAYIRHIPISSYKECVRKALLKAWSELLTPEQTKFSLVHPREVQKLLDGEMIPKRFCDLLSNEQLHLLKLDQVTKRQITFLCDAFMRSLQNEREVKFLQIEPTEIALAIIKGTFDKRFYPLLTVDHFRVLKLSLLDKQRVQAICYYLLYEKEDKSEAKEWFGSIPVSEVERALNQEWLDNADLCQLISDEQLTQISLERISLSQFKMLFPVDARIKETRRRFALLLDRDILAFIERMIHIKEVCIEDIEYLKKISSDDRFNYMAPFIQAAILHTSHELKTSY